MELVSIKHDNVCDECKSRIGKGESCKIELKNSDGGPYLKISCSDCFESGEE